MVISVFNVLFSFKKTMLQNITSVPSLMFALHLTVLIMAYFKAQYGNSWL